MAKRVTKASMRKSSKTDKGPFRNRYVEGSEKPSYGGRRKTKSTKKKNMG